MKSRGKWVILVTSVVLFSTIIGIYISKNKGTILSSDTLSLAHANIERLPMNEIEEVEPGVIPLDAFDNKEEQEMVVALLTFNIRSGNDEDGRTVLDSIIDEILETDADIIGLQEVERRMPRSNFKDQSKEIAEALGYNYIYGSNINVLGVQYGNTIISKYPIVESQNHRLPRVLLEPRGLLEAVIDIEGTHYYVYNTHLGLNSDERDKQLTAIEEKISQRNERIILMGDFNCLSSSREMEGLGQKLVDTAFALDKDHYNTYAFYSDEPNVRIDRIYTSQDVKLKDHYVLPTKTSDHLRVITRIFHIINH